MEKIKNMKCVFVDSAMERNVELQAASFRSCKGGGHKRRFSLMAKVIDVCSLGVETKIPKISICGFSENPL